MMISPQDHISHLLETTVQRGASEKLLSEKEANLSMRRGREQNNTEEAAKNYSSSSSLDDEESSDVAAAREPKFPSLKKNEDYHESKDEGVAAGAISGREEIANPRSADILLGRGRPFQSHEGNKFMLDLVDKYRHRYFKTDRKGKHYIIEEVLGHVKGRGGRFIVRGTKSEENHWVQVARSVSYRKVGHAFRSKARGCLQQRKSPKKHSKAAVKVPSEHRISIAGVSSQSLPNKNRMYASPPPQQISSLATTAAAASKGSIGNKTNERRKKKRDREVSAAAPFSSISAPGITTPTERASGRVPPAFLSSSGGGSSFVEAPVRERRKDDFIHDLRRSLQGDSASGRNISSPWDATSSYASRAGAYGTMGGRPQIAATDPFLGLPRQFPPAASAAAATGGFLPSIASPRQRRYQYHSSAAVSPPPSESTTIAMLRRRQRQQDIMLNEMFTLEHRLGAQHSQLHLHQRNYDESTARAILRQQMLLQQQEWGGDAIGLFAPGHQWQQQQHQQHQLAAGQGGLFQHDHNSAEHANILALLLGTRRGNGGGSNRNL